MRAQTHVLDFHDFAGLLVPEAFAGSALAADVTLYGVVDLGLQYTHSDPDTAAGATDKLQMASGSEAGPRFGLKGVEQLGNGVEVGFVLENGFSADTGALGNNNRLFGRQSTLFVRGSFGEIAFGRMGQLTSGNGSYGLTGNLSPFGTSWGGSVEGSTYMVGYNRMDNTVVYKTPTFGGFTVYAQYSSDMNTKVAGTENKGDSNRYYALGATFNAGALNLVGTVDSYNWDSSNGKKELFDDGLTVPSAVPMTSVLPRPTSVLSTLATCPPAPAMLLQRPLTATALPLPGALSTRPRALAQWPVWVHRLPAVPPCSLSATPKLKKQPIMLQPKTTKLPVWAFLPAITTR